MKKVIIFDFDGTIADSIDYSVEVLHKMSKMTKYKLNKKEIKYKLRNYRTRDLIKEYNISKIQLFFLIFKIRSELKKTSYETKLFPNVKNTLKNLSEKYELILLTSNGKRTVNKILDRENLNCFSQKYFNSKLFGKHKKLSEIIKKNNYNLEEVIYVGDEVRDIESCRKINCDIISVEWGYKTKDLLEKYNPDQIISKPEELIEKLKKLKS